MPCMKFWAAFSSWNEIAQLIMRFLIQKLLFSGLLERQKSTPEATPKCYPLHPNKRI